MNRDEEQGRWILSKGWLSQEVIAQAWEDSQSSGTDLCEALLRKGAINSDQARLTRAAISPSAQPSESSSAPQVPTQYQVLQELGRGGMGVVYLAQHRVTGARCVLKLMLAKSPSLDDKARFEREAQSLAQFKHRSIVGIKEYGSWNGQPFFVMDHIDGQDLKSHVDKQLAETGQVPDFEWTRKLFIALIDALIICHSQGVIHRDLKPHNILIDRETQTPVIVDFGLAGYLPGSMDHEDLTKTGQSLGTPAFMAPEQADAKGNLGAMNQSTDVWGLAATLYYCLTGQTPYKGSTFINVLSQLLKKPPVPAIHVNRNVPAWLNAICTDAMQLKQNLRPSLHELKERLQNPNLSMKAPWPLWVQKARKALLFVTIIALSAGLFLGLNEWFKDRQPPLLQLNAVPPHCGTSFQLSGRVTDDSLKDIYLEYPKTKKRVPLTVTDGQFQAKLESIPGARSYKVVALDANNNRSQKTFSITGHHSLPRVTLTKTHDADLRELKLELRLDSPCDIQLKINDRSRALKGSKFNLKETLKKGQNTLQITATDPYGNTTRLSETIQSNVTLYTVGKQPPKFGDRHFGDLAYAIRKAARSKANVLVLPGQYKQPLVFNLPATIKNSIIKVIGLGTKESPVLVESESGTAARFESGRFLLRNIQFCDKQKRGDNATLFIVKGSVELQNCRIEALSTDKALIGTPAQFPKGRPFIHLSQCQLKGGRHSVFLGPKGELSLSDSKFEGSAKELIFNRGVQLDAQRTQFLGGTRAIWSESESPARLTLSSCRFQGQSSHVMELVKNASLRCENAIIEHKAKERSSFWARAGTKISVRKTVIRGEGGVCFLAVNKGSIDAIQCVLEGSYSVGKVEGKGHLRMVDCEARSTQDTAFHNFQGGRLELIRCRLLKGQRPAVSLCKGASQTIMKGCLIRGFSQAMLMNSPAPLRRVEITQCRFEDNRLIAIEIRGEIATDFTFRNNKIVNNNLGLLLENKGPKLSAKKIVIDSCQFRNNSTNALVFTGPKISAALQDCVVEGHGRKKSEYWGDSAILIRRSKLEIRGGAIQNNFSRALHNLSGTLRVAKDVQFSGNKNPDKGRIQRD